MADSLQITREYSTKDFHMYAGLWSLLTTMNQNKDTVTSIVLACCVLHNIMRIRYPGVHPGFWDDKEEY